MAILSPPTQGVSSLFSMRKDSLTSPLPSNCKPMNTKGNLSSLSIHLVKSLFLKMEMLSCMVKSRAITQYIAYVHSSRGTQLLNLRSHETMATLTMWMEIEAHQFDPPASKLTWEQVIKPIYGLETDQTIVKENEAILEKVLNVYEKRLEESRFLACNSFTLVDLHHLPNIQYLLGTPTKILFEKRTKVRKWVDEITSREAWKMACDQEKSWSNKQRN
ncbi:glutathione S-transferase F4 isoform X3 [Arabidopsis lyrata subsp. lyrata]|uniref:glutathione S-transferase F4 isoform X3 n=1 Tax=Arabidopsis lyrata subsp. lyrata TaxID=81972 RepID=UPI000A29E9DE|nr:glutathione S-transferase F4 isoform X3 [Arabidopsis lyrata subsp. lyrata]|eukprot:XP_020870873.1 glutathione S-transferase F4 isoform X3 [Arabidopsis lyrata subsp. lyrata]